MTCEPTHNYLYSCVPVRMVRAHEAPNLSPLGDLLTLDLEPSPYSHLLLSSTTIASESLLALYVSLLAIPDRLQSLIYTHAILLSPLKQIMQHLPRVCIDVFALAR